MNYFILINNEQQGPFPVNELLQHGLTQETLVWTEGMAQWTPAWQVEELKSLFFNSNGSTPPPPPISPTSTSPKTTTTDTAPAEIAGETNGNQHEEHRNNTTKGKGHKKLWIGLGIIVVILFILALTNPSQAEHRQAILDKVDNASEKIDNISDPTVRSVLQSIGGLGQTVAKQIIVQLIDEDLEYHNYILFSTTSIHSDMLRHDIRCSTGFLGHVNAVSLSNIMPDIIMQQMMGSEKNNSGNTEESTDEETTVSGPQGEQTTVTTKTVKKNGVTIDSISRRVTSRLADEVARKVKDEVKQETDSTTSSDVDGIVDRLLNLLKNLL